MSKVTITPVETDTFKPFVLSIQVDSEEELAVLWSLFNASLSEVVNNSGSFKDKVVHYFNANAYVNTFKSQVWDLLQLKVSTRK